MKVLAALSFILIFICALYTIQIITIQNKEIISLEKEIRELQNQYYNLYNSHNRVLKQIEDMKQF